MTKYVLYNKNTKVTDEFFSLQKLKEKVKELEKNAENTELDIVVTELTPDYLHGRINKRKLIAASI